MSKLHNFLQNSKKIRDARIQELTNNYRITVEIGKGAGQPSFETVLQVPVRDMELVEQAVYSFLKVDMGFPDILINDFHIQSSIWHDEIEDERYVIRDKDAEVLYFSLLQCCANMEWTRLQRVHLATKLSHQQVEKIIDETINQLRPASNRRLAKREGK